MRRIIDLNTTESIRRNKLICKTEWHDLPSQFIIYFFAVVFTLISINAAYTIDYSNFHDRLFVLLPLLLLSMATLYTAYRKATEKHLLKVVTPFGLDQNKIILNTYIRSKGYKSYTIGKDYIIFNKSVAGEFMDHKTEYAIFIVKDGFVLFTTLQEHFRLNWPTFFSHLTMKHELEKILDRSPDN